jgi:hypothetical protein
VYHRISPKCPPPSPVYNHYSHRVGSGCHSV